MAYKLKFNVIVYCNLTYNPFRLTNTNKSHKRWSAFCFNHISVLGNDHSRVILVEQRIEIFDHCLLYVFCNFGPWTLTHEFMKKRPATLVWFTFNVEKKIQCHFENFYPLTKPLETNIGAIILEAEENAMNQHCAEFWFRSDRVLAAPLVLLRPESARSTVLTSMDFPSRLRIIVCKHIELYL